MGITDEQWARKAQESIRDAQKAVDELCRRMLDNADAASSSAGAEPQRDPRFTNEEVEKMYELAGSGDKSIAPSVASVRSRVAPDTSQPELSPELADVESGADEVNAAADQHPQGPQGADAVRGQLSSAPDVGDDAQTDLKARLWGAIGDALRDEHRKVHDLDYEDPIPQDDEDVIHKACGLLVPVVLDTVSAPGGTAGTYGEGNAVRLMFDQYQRRIQELEDEVQRLAGSAGHTAQLEPYDRAINIVISKFPYHEGTRAGDEALARATLKALGYPGSDDSNRDTA